MNSCVRCQNKDIVDITKQLAFLLNLILENSNNVLPCLDSYDKYYSEAFSLEYKRDYFKNTKCAMPKQSEEMRILLQIINVCFIVCMNDVMERYSDDRIILRYSVGKLIPLLELYEVHSPDSVQKDGFKHNRECFMRNLTEVKNWNSYDIVTRFMDSSVEILMDYPKLP